MRIDEKSAVREAKRIERTKLKLNRHNEEGVAINYNEEKPTIWSALRKHNAINEEPHVRTTEKHEALRYEEKAEGDVKIV